MKKELNYIAPLRAGIVLGVLYGILGLIVALILVPTMLVMSAMGGRAALPGAFGGMLFGILMPFFYALMGFVGGVIGAALYNLIARWTGGLEFEVRDVGPAA